MKCMAGQLHMAATRHYNLAHIADRSWNQQTVSRKPQIGFLTLGLLNHVITQGAALLLRACREHCSTLRCVSSFNRADSLLWPDVDIR